MRLKKLKKVNPGFLSRSFSSLLKTSRNISKHLDTYCWKWFPRESRIKKCCEAFWFILIATGRLGDSPSALQSRAIRLWSDLRFAAAQMHQTHQTHLMHTQHVSRCFKCSRCSDVDLFLAVMFLGRSQIIVCLGPWADLGARFRRFLIARAIFVPLY